MIRFFRLFFISIPLAGSVLAFFGPSPAFAQYGGAGQPYTQTANQDNCVSSSVSLNTMAINQFYLYSASGVSVLYASGVNTPGTGTINLSNPPPAGAATSIVKAYLEVVEWDNGTGNSCSSASISFGGQPTGAGTVAGQGNFENLWTDPRYLTDLEDDENNYFCDVRYDVTSLVAAGTSSYTTNASNSVDVLDALVVVYTINSPGACGAVALADGLFVWGGSQVGGSDKLDFGVTPWYSTLDWSCQHNTACASNQFSRWGGVDNPDDGPMSIADEFFGTDSPVTNQPPSSSLGAGTIFQDPSVENDTFLDTYSNVPLSDASGKITWALGNPFSGSKVYYWVNLLAASCASVCDTPTPTPTPTSTSSATASQTPTASFTATGTPTPSATPTDSPTPTASGTPTNSMTPSPTASSTPTCSSTPSSTPSASPTSTGTPTDSATPTSTGTPTNSATLTATFTDSPTATDTPTPTPTGTATDSATPTATPTLTPTDTATSTFTDSPTVTDTPTPTATFTDSPTATDSPTSTPSGTPTSTPTVTDSFTPTLTPTVTPTFTLTFTPTLSPTPTDTGTPTLSPTWTSTSTPTDSPTASFTSTPTPSPTESFTPTATGTPTLTPTVTATFTPTFTPTVTSSFTATGTPTPTLPPQPYQVRLSIYNSAGELVKQLLVEKSAQPITSLNLGPGNTITTLGGPDGSVSIFSNGTFLAVWDATNGSGNPVSNGTYFVKADSVDSLGTDQSVVQTVTVDRYVDTVEVEVLNEAGEVVRVLYGQEESAGPITGCRLSSPLLQEGPASQGGVTITLSDGTVLTWDGRSSDGGWVTSGLYYLQVISQDGAKGEEVLTQVVTVVNGGRAGTGVWAYPNPCRAGQGPVTLQCSSATPETLKVLLYDVAGEKVAALQGAPQSNQAVLNNGNLANGLYLAVVELWNGNGGLDGRQVLKVVLEH